MELSSHQYDFPSLTTSMKLEQRELESSTKEHIYDYARVHAVHALERSEYVVSIISLTFKYLRIFVKVTLILV